MGATRDAAEYIVKAGDLSQQEGVCELVEQALVDSIGVALFASTVPLAGGLMRGFTEPGAHRVIGSKQRLPAGTAVMVNASLIHAEDWDDMGGCGGHPSAALFPPLLALAETTGASGREFIDAYACGYQVGSVLGRYLKSEKSFSGRSWHPSAVVAPLAAAAASSRLLRLPVEQAANALGMAASFSGGFQGQFGTSAKALQLGKSSMGGYLAATLAAQGLTGDTEILERSNGFGACFAPGASWRFMAHDLEGPLYLTSRKGKGGMDFRVAAKQLPLCGGAISGITALEAALGAEQVAVSDIEELVIQETRDQTKQSMFRSPYTGVGEHGKFSLPYSLAARLVFKEVSPHATSDEAARKVLDSGILPRIRVVVQPFAEARPPISRVWLRLKDGRTLNGESFAHHGETEPAMLAAKFRLAVADVMDDNTAAAVLQKLGGL